MNGDDEIRVLTELAEEAGAHAAPISAREVVVGE